MSVFAVRWLKVEDLVMVAERLMEDVRLEVDGRLEVSERVRG